jgi:ribokinase
VIVVGNLTLDDVVLPDGTTRMAAVGGNGVYASLGARLWEPGIGLVTRRGEDFPPEHLAVLAGLGVDTAGVVDIPGPTVRNWIVYETDGRRHWAYRTPPERSNEVAVQPEDVPDAWLDARPAPVVHVAAMPLPAAEAIVARVRGAAPDARVTLDTHEDWAPAGYRDRVLTLAAGVHAFLPSREELADLMGYDDPERAVGELSTLPTTAVVVKMGAQGSLVWDGPRETLTAVGVAPGHVSDVTGAGDAFCGGFAAAVATGLAFDDAAVRGAVSAAFTVEDFGSLRLGEIRPEDAERRLASAPPPTARRPRPTASGRSGGDRAIAVMRSEIDTIPSVIADQSEALAGRLDQLAASMTDVDHLVLTGCGDSMFAAAASTLSFARHAGIDAQAVHAMELARYRVRYLPERTAVVCISHSGEVGRTIEAAAQARTFGHRTVALTGRKDGRLALEADESVLLEVPTLGFSPGTSTYVAMVAALLRLSLAMGEARGRDVAEARASLDRVPELAGDTLARTLEPARAVAGRLIGRPWVSFAGAGPNEASARFGAAKMFEGPQIMGVATNLEEWAHEEYFVTGAGTPVVMVAPSGASFDRAREILDELAFVGADAVLVSDEPAPAPAAWLPLAAGLPEEFSPLLAALPLSLLGFLVSEATGKRSYNFLSPEAEREHYETIHRDTRGTPA